jgi:hypothetical protein
LFTVGQNAAAATRIDVGFREVEPAMQRPTAPSP